MRFLCALSLGLLAFTGFAAVVNLAPNFTWEGPPRANSLRAVRGQPVVLLIAKNSRVHAFRAQVAKLKELYQEFASRKVIFVAALADGSADVRSNIPFALANNGAKVAQEFEVNENFNVVIIGRDGNIDYQTDRVLPASRVLDVLVNSFVEQNDRRR